METNHFTFKDKERYFERINSIMRIKTLKIKILYISGLIGLLFVACLAKPPTEEISAITNKLQELEAQGAKEFAPEQYELVLKDMKKIREFRDNQKYRDAKFKCEVATISIRVLESLIKKNAFYKAKDSVISISIELKKYKNILDKESTTILPEEELEKLRKLASDFDSKISETNKKLDNEEYLEVYSESKEIKTLVIKSIIDLDQKIQLARKKAKGSR